MQASHPRRQHTAVAIKLTAYLYGYSAHKQKQTAPLVVAATSQPLLGFFCQAFFHLEKKRERRRQMPAGRMEPEASGICISNPLNSQSSPKMRAQIL